MDDPDPQARADALSYKLRKEAFVSNLSGSSLLDINLVTLVAASAVLLWSAVAKRGLLTDADPQVVFTIDFLLNVCAILFAFTAYSSVPGFLNLALIVPAVLLLLPLQNGGNSERKKAGKASAKASNDSKAGEKGETGLKPGRLIVRPFLTNYRGSMLVVTSIAILAVDFHVFPRRFAKVETWGTSLMDLGVGSFVFSAGIVGARPAIRESQQADTKRHAMSAGNRVAKAMRHSLPLFALGVARLISVKNLDYAEHVTEYGVHWNFFFTLALLPPFVETIDGLLALIKSSSNQATGRRSDYRNDIVALLISSIYEAVLNTTRLLPFILVAPRTPDSDLITKNREGVFSFFGYLSIFLIGRSTGVLVCQFQTQSPAIPKKGTSALEAELQGISAERRTVVLPHLLGRTVVFSALYLIATSVHTFNLTVSRRLGNLPYVLWTAAFNHGQLFLFALIEALGPQFTFNKYGQEKAPIGGKVIEAPAAASRIMHAFNSNGLALFLLANLGTGLVNLTMNTLDTGNVKAMGILITYMAVLSFVADRLNSLGIKIKI